MINFVLWTMICFFTAGLAVIPPDALARDEYQAEVKRYSYNLPDLTVIGSPAWHEPPPKETMLDVARRFGLGYNEVELVYPHMDHWTPPSKRRLFIPTSWILPPTECEQLVINLPELRLYFFDKKTSTVQTFPIGIGDEGWESPLGTFKIVDKRTNPTWYIPASLQEKYGMASMPPGPENPLGHFIMKFSAGAYGIHGTTMPWGVGRLVSHGCIRCYPEHIKILYPQVRMGTKLEIIYEPVKLGKRDGQVFVEAHPDVYRKIPDYSRYAMEKLLHSPFAEEVDRKKFMTAIRLKNGFPFNVSRFDVDDISQSMIELTHEDKVNPSDE